DQPAATDRIPRRPDVRVSGEIALRYVTRPADPATIQCGSQRLARIPMDRILRGRRNVRPLGAVAECEDLHLDNVDELATHFRLGHCLPDLKRHHRVTAGDRILGLLVYEAKGISPPPPPVK